MKIEMKVNYIDKLNLFERINTIKIIYLKIWIKILRYNCFAPKYLSAKWL